MTSTTLVVPANRRTKSTDATVFVRFIPPHLSIRRHHVEDLFSEIGPIHKSAVIHKNNDHNKDAADTTQTTTTTTTTTTSSSSSFAFVKYTTQADAVTAARTLSGRWLTLPATTAYESSVKVQLQVELASSAAATLPKQQQSATHQGSVVPTTTTTLRTIPQNPKRARVFVRNLSFYATESQIRTVLQHHFGPILEIHLPTVDLDHHPNNSAAAVDDDKNKNNKHTRQKKKKTQHRGFAFVTFAQRRDALRAVQHAEPVLIHNRPVQISWSVPKEVHDASSSSSSKKNNNDTKHRTGSHLSNETNESAEQPPMEEEEENDDDEKEENDDDEKEENDDDEKKENDDDEEEEEEQSDEDDNDEDNDDDDDHAQERDQEDHHDHDDHAPHRDESAVAEQRSLFLRNLPFDATRHDLFQLLRPFGHVTGIYLVKDKVTGIPKGTAFISFATAQSAQQALVAAAGGTAATNHNNNDDNNNKDSQDDGTPAATATVSSFVAQRHVSTSNPTATSSLSLLSSNGGLVLKGRRILANLAVDKDTALTLTDHKDSQQQQQKPQHVDRRNLYLKEVGRVHNDPARGRMDWDGLPASDRFKRSAAWAETNTKLKSPLFFINPVRLSIRNLAKHVNEVDFKKLLVTATVRGLQRNLVTLEDQIAQWKACGEMTTRDILAKLEALEKSSTTSTTSARTAANGNNDTNTKDNSTTTTTTTTTASLWPAFETKNIKQFLPSVYISRDVVSSSGGTTSTKKNKNQAPSRGFGFAEFVHHMHALACLRELNNNPKYSRDYVTGGRRAVELKQQQSGRRSKKRSIHSADVGEEEEEIGKIPRLIVEFSVENKIKARQQADHRIAQQVNQTKQKRQHQQAEAESKQPKQRTSRGALQRARKRQQRSSESHIKVEDDDGKVLVSSKDHLDDATQESTKARAVVVKTTTTTTTKPSKKRKMDREEETFKTLVESYKRTFATTADGGTGLPNSDTKSQKKDGQRWFDGG